MIPVALYHNKPVKQNIVGRLRHEVLRPSIKPLPTLPPIVGNSRYKPEMMEVGNSELPAPQNPGTEFIKRRMMSVRRFNAPEPKVIAEPNNNSPNRYQKMPNAWISLVQKTYAEMKKKNPKATYTEAMKAAKAKYKK